MARPRKIFGIETGQLVLLAILTGIAAVILIFVPFDGPFGEIAMGIASAILWVLVAFSGAPSRGR